MARLFDNDNKYPIIILLIVCFFVIIVALAVVFSNIKFKPSVNGTVATILNDGDLVINYVDGEEMVINDSKEHNYGISLTNSGTEKIYYSIYFSSANVQDIKVTIKDSSGKIVNEIDKDIVENKFINLLSIDAGETIRYTVSVTGSNTLKFKGTLKVINESLSTDIFSDLILMNNVIAVPKTRVGTDIATQNEGLISSTDNKGTTYYFRGNVDNNYVKMNDNLFRIVRINGDSTVRLVLNNTIKEQYPYNVNTIQDGQNIGELADLTKSSLINKLNSWVKNNLSEYDNYLVNGNYCTDTTFNHTINGINYSSTYTRIFRDFAPDLYCSGNNYEAKVGLLSVDEVVMAGAATNQPNTSYYLYNKEIVGNYVTSSSYFIGSSNNIAMINIMSNGAIGDGIVITNSSYIRPVINIGVSAKVKGSGTINDPYIIVS